MVSKFISELFKLENFAHKALFEDRQYPWDALKELKNYLFSHAQKKIEGNISSQAHLFNEEQIVIGVGSTVEAGAYIKGPCIIGENCSIRHGAYIRGHVLTGNHCVIGHSTEIKNSILLNNAHAAHFAYVGDSILGNDTNLGAGCKCANLRLDRKNVVAFFKNHRIETNLKKLGLLLGDGCQIGCNCVCSPGTILSMNVMSHPCLHIKRFVPPDSMVKSSIKFFVESMLT